MLLALKKRLTAEADRGIKSALRLSHQFLFRCEAYTLCSPSLQSTKCGPQQASWQRNQSSQRRQEAARLAAPLPRRDYLKGAIAGTPSTETPVPRGLLESRASQCTVLAVPPRLDLLQTVPDLNSHALCHAVRQPGGSELAIESLHGRLWNDRSWRIVLKNSAVEAQGVR